MPDYFFDGSSGLIHSPSQYSALPTRVPLTVLMNCLGDSTGGSEFPMAMNTWYTGNSGGGGVR